MTDHSVVPNERSDRGASPEGERDLPLVLHCLKYEIPHPKNRPRDDRPFCRPERADSLRPYFSSFTSFCSQPDFIFSIIQSSAIILLIMDTDGKACCIIMTWCIRFLYWMAMVHS